MNALAEAQQDRVQAGALGAVVLRRAGVADDQFAEQGSDGEDGRIGQPGRVLRRRHPDEVQFERTVGVVGVDRARGHPDGAVARGDPGARAGGDPQDPATVAGIVLAASLLSSAAQPLFGLPGLTPEACA